MNNKIDLLSNNEIRERIFTFREVQVMVDRDLAELYGVSTKRLNEQVKRNIKRFPSSFRFKLSDGEKNELVANCDRLKNLKHSVSNPYVFTEQGIAMLSSVLHSDTAIKISIRIIEAFVEMRKFILNNALIFQKLERLELKQIETDKKLDDLFNAIQKEQVIPQKGIFYDGQVFDAYKLLSDIIKTAKESIVLIDNYIDESVLVHFGKRQNGVSLVIYTNVTKQRKLDLEKFKSQYPDVVFKEFHKSHDRFMIIDHKYVYHIGASLKDIGKKWFAFSRMDKEVVLDILNKLDV